MRIGIDFDNTIVRYDRLFHRAAVDAGLIYASVPPNKNAVRNRLREDGREEDWIELQGLVYGARMSEADPFPGVLDFFRDAQRAGVEVFIISHKTLHPFQGPKYDLHAAARDWIAANLMSDETPLVPFDNIFFELTKLEKLNRIAACKCHFFIDDLPEILLNEAFPKKVERLLFDPDGYFTESKTVRRFTGWVGLSQYLLPHGSVAANQADATK